MVNDYRPVPLQKLYKFCIHKLPKGEMPEARGTHPRRTRGIHQYRHMTSCDARLPDHSWPVLLRELYKLRIQKAPKS
jgi:hypothetical protein